MSTGLVIQVAERRDCDEARNIHGRRRRAGRARSVLRDPEIIGMDMSSPAKRTTSPSRAMAFDRHINFLRAMQAQAGISGWQARTRAQAKAQKARVEYYAQALRKIERRLA